MGAIAGIHHEASRLPPPATPPLVHGTNGSRRRNVRSRDYDCEAGRFLDVSMPAHLVSPLSAIHSPAGGEWEGGGGTHPGGHPSIRIQRSAAIVERERYLLFRTPRASSPVAAGWESEREKGSGTWVAVLRGCICTMLNDKKSDGQRRMRVVEGKMPAFLLHAHQS